MLDSKKKIKQYKEIAKKINEKMRNKRKLHSIITQC